MLPSVLDVTFESCSITSPLTSKAPSWIHNEINMFSKQDNWKHGKHVQGGGGMYISNNADL